MNKSLIDKLINVLLLLFLMFDIIYVILCFLNVFFITILFLIVMRHTYFFIVSECLTYIAMPINNIQFRAVIGFFYNALQCVPISMSLLRFGLVYCSFNNIYLEIRKLGSGNICPSMCHLLSCLIILVMFPFILSFTKIITQSFNISKLFICSYLYIYICIRFIFNLFWFTIARKAFAKFIVQYFLFFQICIFVPFVRLALLKSGDIEINPGPEISCNQNLSLCHWNLNGIAANDFVKISLLAAFNAVHTFNIICVSETFLDSDYSSDDPRLSLQGYAMIRSDHPSNTKRGGVCIYYKEHLPFVRRNDIACLDECIVGEIRVKNSKCFVTCLYRSPNQTADERNVFLSGLEQIGSSIALESPICSFVIGDLNAKCTHWWPEGTSNACGLELHNISSLLGYSQIINEPTNLEPNKSPSCIDLIFASQPNLVVESGIYPSLTNTCHHQIIHAKVSFKIHLPSPYEREVWHYNRAQVHLIKRSIDL